MLVALATPLGEVRMRASDAVSVAVAPVAPDDEADSVPVAPVPGTWIVPHDTEPSEPVTTVAEVPPPSKV